MNYAELQEKHDKGLLTPDECYRTGSTHAAYGWAKQQQGIWTEAQRIAYINGYNDYLKQVRS